MTKLGSVRVVPLSYGKTGWDEADEGAQDFFAAHLYDNHKGYGEGWMPLYDFQTGTKADAFGYMYLNKADAVRATDNYTKEQVS
jgi:hypothetical protein